MTEQEFTQAYWLHFNPDIRALKDMEFASPERQARAVELAKLYPIDGEIHAIGMNPYYTTTLRKLYGYTWVPSYLQDPIILAPGIYVPETLSGKFKPYDPNNPPVGSIKVSLDLQDYPPYTPVAPPAPIPGVTAEPWWERAFGPGQYAVRVGDVSPNNTKWSGPQGTFWKHLSVGFAGMINAYWSNVEVV